MQGSNISEDEISFRVHKKRLCNDDKPVFSNSKPACTLLCRLNSQPNSEANDMMKLRQIVQHGAAHDWNNESTPPIGFAVTVSIIGSRNGDPF